MLTSTISSFKRSLLSLNNLFSSNSSTILPSFPNDIGADSPPLQGCSPRHMSTVSTSTLALIDGDKQIPFSEPSTLSTLLPTYLSRLVSMVVALSGFSYRHVFSFASRQLSFPCRYLQSMLYRENELCGASKPYRNAYVNPPGAASWAKWGRQDLIKDGSCCRKGKSYFFSKLGSRSLSCVQQGSICSRSGHVNFSSVRDPKGCSEGYDARADTSIEGGASPRKHFLPYSRAHTLLLAVMAICVVFTTSQKEITFQHDQTALRFFLQKHLMPTEGGLSQQPFADRYMAVGESAHKEDILSGSFVEQRGTKRELKTIFGTIFLQPPYTTNLVPAKGNILRFDLKDVAYTTISGANALPFSYGLYLFEKGIVATIKPTQVVLDVKISGQQDGEKHWWQSSASDIYVFSSRFMGVPQGVLFGTTDAIPRDFYQDFLNSGLVYLVAASGGNISFLIAFLGVLFLFIPFKRRRWVHLGGVSLYAYALRSNVALARAAISYFLSFWGRAYGKTVSPRKMLLVVVVMCCVINPYLIVSSWGFILSVSGVWGILHIPTKISHHRLGQYVSPSVWAFAALLGPLLVLTQRVNFLTMIASLPAQFLTMIITYLSLILLLIGGIFPPVAELVANILFWCVKGLYYIVRYTATEGFFWEISKDSLLSRTSVLRGNEQSLPIGMLLVGYGLWALCRLFIRRGFIASRKRYERD